MILLAWIAGLLSGLTFAAGLLVGAWQQRRLKAEVAVEAARKELIRKVVTEEDRYETVPDGKGLGHPGGVVPPTFDEAMGKRKSKIPELLRHLGRSR